MPTLSAVLIIKNEAAYIERALSSLLWCDEIVVVDAMSTDTTPELCKDVERPWSSKLRFIQQEWLGFSAQRNFALTQAKGDWIFFLDGDECCSPELAVKIRNTIQAPASLAQYKIRRQEYFLNKPIRHGIWNPSYHIRLFPKTGVQFTGEVHEGVISKLETRMIDEPIQHVEDLRIERFMTKLNSYTTLQAQADFERGKRTNIARIFCEFPAMFYKNYIYYGAYKDGVEGIIISILEGISRTVRHLKLWQVQRLAKHK